MNSTPHINKIVSNFGSESGRAKILAALSAGFTSGIALLVGQVVFGSFIFSGPLSAYLSQGIGLILFGNFAACLIVALVSSYRGAIAGLSSAVMLVMATLVASIELQGRELFVTASFALMLSAFVTGICCFVLGRFQLTNLVRFIPFPVSCGFVAGIGGLVFMAALSLLGAKLSWLSVQENFELQTLIKWLPSVVFGVLLYAAIKRWKNALILPLGVALVIVAYQVALIMFDISREEAQEAGLLLVGTLDGSLWPVLYPLDLVDVNLSTLVAQIPNLLTLMLIALICVLLNISGLEVTVNQDLDWDREFKASGLASMVAGIGGGTVATLIVPSSYRSKIVGAMSRLTGIVAASVVGVALLFGDRALDYIPTTLVGGILFFAAIGMIEEGLVKTVRWLPWSEYSIVLLISFCIVFLGLIDGVVIGMLTMLILFVIRLSRVGSIGAYLSARQCASNKVRAIPERAILLAEGERVGLFKLNGYVFFGSVTSLVSELRKSLERSTPPVCLLLDFEAVTGFDYSAVSALSRFMQSAYTSGIQLVLSQPSAKMISGLQDSLPNPVFEALTIEANFDRGLERCEDFVIASWSASATTPSQQRLAAILDQSAGQLEQFLDRQVEFEALIEALDPWLTTTAYEAGDTLASSDSSQSGLQLLVSGRASAYDQSGNRVLQFSRGDAVLANVNRQENVTAVVADEHCQTKFLSQATRDWLEQHDKDLSLNLYRYLFGDYLQNPTCTH